jgi:hypothetical protein
MGSARRLGTRAVLCAAVAALTLSVSQASGAKPNRHEACTWGASSIRAHRVNGRIVTTSPAETGCIPR